MSNAETTFLTSRNEHVIINQELFFHSLNVELDRIFKNVNYDFLEIDYTSIETFVPSTNWNGTTIGVSFIYDYNVKRYVANLIVDILHS